MKRSVTFALAATLLVSCRGYDYRETVSHQDGLLPAEQYARYGREQAQVVAAGRELASQSPDSTGIGAAVKYARGLPDVADVTPDARGQWLMLRFKSGWIAATPPLADGKRGADTPGVTSRP